MKIEENRRISNFKGLVTLTLTLDRVVQHTVMHQHHSLTSTYIPNFIGIRKTFCGRTDVRTYGWTDRHFVPHIDIISRPKKLEATQHRWLGKILHISLKDMVSNKKVRELTGQ